MITDIKNIIEFWFKDCKPKDWFKKNKKFDLIIEHRFLKLVENALQNKLNFWEKSMDGSIALILLLDQFTRNIFRDSAKSFSGDNIALAITFRCIDAGYLETVNQPKRQFILVPMMHSEKLDIQDKSLPLFKKYTNQQVYKSALRHRDVIKRFGRFPHRNKILDRVSSQKEIKFLKEPRSSF
tara:strand:+ start:1884 stop:2429 length:546 start_codon:yes stop_codon:yes gene_type:complete